MKLEIRHATTYRYDHPGWHLIQRMHLTPMDAGMQKVVDWSIEAPGIERALSYTDAFGNFVHVVTPPPELEEISVVACGLVETSDTSGLAGRDAGAVPLGAFLRQTPITEPNAAIRSLTKSLKALSGLEKLHALMGAVREQIAYEVGTTNAHTTAAEAIRDGNGVCQDQAHVFISAARAMDVPARYVSGYMQVEEGEVAEASHAWAEGYVPDLGWVGFDVANGICPDERYVRVAVAMDAAGARPVKGVRRGMIASSESLNVEVLVEKVADQ